MEYENISVVVSKRDLIQHSSPSLEPRSRDYVWLYGVVLIGVVGAGIGGGVWYRQAKRNEDNDAV